MYKFHKTGYQIKQEKSKQIFKPQLFKICAHIMSMFYTIKNYFSAICDSGWHPIFLRVYYPISCYNICYPLYFLLPIFWLYMHKLYFRINLPYFTLLVWSPPQLLTPPPFTHSPKVRISILVTGKYVSFLSEHYCGVQPYLIRKIFCGMERRKFIILQHHILAWIGVPSSEHGVY